MYNWAALFAQELDHREMMHDSEKEWRIRQAIAAAERHDPLYCQALAWLGSRFIQWGETLQKRYGTSGSVNLLTQTR